MMPEEVEFKSNSPSVSVVHDRDAITITESTASIATIYLGESRTLEHIFLCSSTG